MTEAWYPGKSTLQKTTAVANGITAQQNANHDNADADAGKPKDTPERLRRNASAANKTSETVCVCGGGQKPGHPRTSARETRRNKRPTEPIICQEDRKARNNTVRG